MSPAELKRRITLENELDRRGLLVTLKRKPVALVGPCPIHGGDNPTAFVVDTQRQLWHCFTGCQKGGDIFDLVRAIDGFSFPAAMAYLEHQAGNLSTVPQARVPSPGKQFRPFTRVVPLDPAHPFLQAKGITPGTAGLFEAGYSGRRGFLSNCIAVRLFDTAGKPLGYAGRRLDPIDIARFGKWKFPWGLPKREILYNYHNLERKKAIVLTECPWGVMRLNQIGVQGAALLGTSLSKPQGQLLTEFPLVTILFDGDQAGRKGATMIEAALKNLVLIRAATLPEGTDPDDLDDEKLRETLVPFIFT